VTPRHQTPALHSKIDPLALCRSLPRCPRGRGLEEAAPRGSLSYAEGPRIRFAGWTEFASAIENWREEAPQSDREST
jgi:hypothetical protein